MSEARPAKEIAADEAMAAYAEGEDRAFSKVHAAIGDRLFAFLMRMTRSRATADDLLQETFLRMHRARGSFAKGARVLPWAYAIARNVYIDNTRGATQRFERLQRDDDFAELPTKTQEDGEQVTAAKEIARVVEKTLEKLPPNQREAFVLLRYEGMSVADAAEVLGCTEGAVKLRAFHAYEAFRAALATTTGDEPRAKRGAS